MKTTSVITVITFLCAGLGNSAFSQNIGINTTGAIPSTNAILDLNTGNSNNLGLIIPNVSLTALSTFKPPIANAATAGDKGMMVYNTNTAVGSGVGYYYWSGTAWVAVSGSASTVTGANNGLTLNSSNVQLGGILLANTAIASGGFNLSFTGSGLFQLGAASTSTGTLQFYNSGSANAIGISAGATSAAYNLTLPTAGPTVSGQTLTSTTAGVMSWATPPTVLKGIIYDTTAGTSTPTLAAGTTWILIKAVGGGGAGGGLGNSCYSTDEAGSGGGAGGYCEGYLLNVTGSTTISITVGAGGAGAAGCNNSVANAGGNTTVVTTLPSATFTANGGSGGKTTQVSATSVNLLGGKGGSASGGTINMPGANGGNAIVSQTGTDVVFAGEGGSSIYGNGGPQQYTRDNVNYAGINALSPGAGGGGAVAVQQTSAIATKGGNGGHGMVIIYEY